MAILNPNNQMKKISILIWIVVTVCITSCEEPTPAAGDNYSSVQDFFSQHAPSMQTYTINGTTGGSFTTPQGTVVTIPPNAFVTQASVPVTGDVTIEFKDIYKKSDMLLADMPTTTISGNPLKSGGEFFIKASLNDTVVLLAPGKKITVAQPAALTGGLDPLQQPFIIQPPDTGWVVSPSDSVNSIVNNYVFSLYQFNSPVDSGSWCNSDNSTYFSAYPQTTLTLQHNNDSVTSYLSYNAQVFLIFTNISTMVHVYDNGTNFPYNYAPQGLPCTVVAFGVKDGKLYSSFVSIIIGSNQTVNFTLGQTTTAEFKTQLEALN